MTLSRRQFLWRSAAAGAGLAASLQPELTRAAEGPDITRGATPAGWKFTFGPGKAAPGFVPVTPETLYTAERGYGFEPGGPSFFSVAVPEGNYRVTLTLGDPSEACETTVKAEARRLMLEKVETAPSQTVTRTFTVNVRRPELWSGGRVRLKRDEQPHRDWDDRLTLEFSGARQGVNSLDIARVDHAVTVYLAGDSTVTDQGQEPWCAWGQMLPRFFGPGAAVANHAESGESLHSFRSERRLDKILETIRAGDYLLIQFGHNDQKEQGVGVGAFTTYKADLEQFVAQARQHGAIPVLVTSMPRRRFDAQGKIVNTLGDYPEAVCQTAKEQRVPLIDLNAMSKTLFEALGPQETLKAFVHYPAGTFPGQTAALKDDTHFNAYGAYELARCVIEGIRASVPALAKFLLPDAPAFDPGHPDSPDAWSLPPSPSSTSATPEGS